MNIDQFKSAWQEQPVTQTPNTSWSNLLAQDNKNPITKLKQRTKFEWIGGSIIHIGCAAFFLISEHMPLAAAAYILLGIYSFFYSKKQMQLITSMEALNGPVYSTITKQVETLKQFFNRNVLFATLLVPGLLVFLGFMLYRKTGELPVEDFPTTFPEAVLPYTGIILLLTILMFIISKISIKMKYGKLLQQLKNKAAQFAEA